MIYAAAIAGILVGFIVGWLIARQESVALRASIEAQRSSIEEARAKLSESFSAAAAQALQINSERFSLESAASFKAMLEQSKGDLSTRQEAIAGLVKPLSDSLERYNSQIREMENASSMKSGELKAMLEQLSSINVRLENQTRSLTTALKRPEVKGRWGEVTLRRAVEVSGMSPYCDFDEQPSASTEEGRKRPDMIVKLPQGHFIVVDSKAPLDAYMEAVEAQDEGSKTAMLVRHAQKVRSHMMTLSSKEYWKDFSPQTEFVVLFLPGESFFSAALENDRQLIEDGIAKRVIIATPTTLIALLRTVAASWQQHKLSENAREIGNAGFELLSRLSVFAEHMKKIKDGLQKAVNSFNQAAGSWESRVLPSALKMKDLSAQDSTDNIPAIDHVDGYIKTLKTEKDDGISTDNKD